MPATDFQARIVPAAAAGRLTASGLDPVLARVYAARGVESAAELGCDPALLLAPGSMRGLDQAARLLADAIEAGARLMIVADYDCDGATACAIGLRALSAFGARVDFIVPNRFEYGYGLTPEIVRLAAAHPGGRPDWLVTVDNGIASVDGVAEATRLGMRTLVTDHHLPGERLPDAACIVNPNQPGCPFPSKHLAGCGVMFYAMLALRAELRARGRFATRAEPNFAALADLVALGTVADVVPLDRNNRLLVSLGLARIRAARASPGIRALLAVAGRSVEHVAAHDLGYAVAPRINAAGRLTDMTLGIECLATDDEDRAARIARELDRLNRDRREIEAGMREQAFAALEAIEAAAAAGAERASICVYEPDWHQGVIGIVAGRVKDRAHRPAIAFARASDGELKGSGRSIAALHLRDALDLVSKREPDLLLRFGGHAAAAGLAIRETDYERFATAFERVASEWLSPPDLERVVETDGALAPGEITLDLARALERPVWGHGFPAPEFENEFRVTRQRIVGERHLRLELERDGRRYAGILFGQTGPLPEAIRAVYRPQVHRWQGAEDLQVTIAHWRPAR